jgi:pyridoxine 4-dehydrogenase
MTTTATAGAAGTVTIGGDLRVHRLGFGGMRLCGPGVWDWPQDRENALAVLRRAQELGVNFIDTADSYGPYVNEEQIAQALYPYPADLVIATKGGLERQGPGQWSRNCRPERLKKCCEASLKRLRLERIDLYQLHAVDPKVPLADSVGALKELQAAGKIRHVGLSNVSIEELREARRIVKIVSVQNDYSVGDHAEHDAMVDECEREGLAFLPYFPLGGGDVSTADAVAAVAAAHNATVHQVSLAWLLARSKTMLPIPGTSSLAHLEENVAAAGLRLSEEEVAALSHS